MKTRTLILICFLCFSVLLIVGSCATKRTAVSHEDVSQKIDGTWINPDNPGGDLPVGWLEDVKDVTDAFHFQKFILTSDNNEWYIYKLLDDGVNP
jgi:hypothetical protein